MTTAKWPRPHWRNSHHEGFVLWFVFGDLPPDFRIDAERYRTRGTPAGIEVVRYVNRELAKWDGYPLAGSLGQLLYEENAKLFEQASRARDCVMLRGSLIERGDLDELRDLVGSISALTDHGAIAVLDPQTLSMWSAEDWRQTFFAHDAFCARDHVLILCNADERNEGRMHVHTRGLRKFARPDISIRNVPPDDANGVGELASRLVDFQADGGLIRDGYEIEIEGLPKGLVLHEAGSLEDPDFNNRHLALRWPG